MFIFAAAADDEAAAEATVGDRGDPLEMFNFLSEARFNSF